jgi:putative tryptophan/tyrosine transport system substrate-binding protein
MATRLGAAAALILFAVPLVVQAQPLEKVPRIGLLHIGWRGSPEAQTVLDAFWQGLRDHGYVEGRNILVEYRWAEGKVERLPGLATELAHLKVDLIVAAATPAARAARQATATIPIVAMAMGDPVGDGLVASLARPGGNLTGTSFLGPMLLAKHLELLREASPRISRVAILWHPGAFAASTMGEMLKEAQAAAATLRLQLHRLEVQNPEGLEPVFSTITRERPDALVVAPSTMLFNLRGRIVTLATKHRLPSLFNSRQAVELGGLIGYGANLPRIIRRTATYVDKILKGATPAELPVEQPTTFELVINLKTAKALGLTIPPSLLLRADQVIE